jgi:ATP-dependent protease ClpP protease subunit
MSAEQAVSFGLVDHVLEKRGQLPGDLKAPDKKS